MRSASWTISSCCSEVSPRPQKPPLTPSFIRKVPFSREECPCGPRRAPVPSWSRELMRRKRYAIEDLRRAIDCLPVETRAAMLEGVRSNDIIVGAYTNRDGGVCPMLAAHRNGGRTSLISFARTWDRFTGAKRARRATQREPRMLTAHLEASRMPEGMRELEDVVAAHRERLEHNVA